MNPTPRPALAALLLGSVLLTGCSYYQITDPHSGKVYYAKSWKAKNEESGVIVFKNAANGDKVTLATHEIRKVSQKKFNASVSQQVANQP